MKERSAAGKNQEKSKQSKPLLGKKGTTLIDLQPKQSQPITELLLSTPESVVAPSNPTLTDKSPILAASTRKPKSVAKSEEVLTSSVKNFFPYWNESLRAMSEWLSLPTKTVTAKFKSG
jgi:putative transposase